MKYLFSIQIKLTHKFIWRQLYTVMNENIDTNLDLLVKFKVQISKVYNLLSLHNYTIKV